MDRRTFTVGVAAAVISGPRLAWAQEKRRIAIVHPTTPIANMTTTGHAYYAAFLNELSRLGWVEGENLTIDRHNAVGRADFAAFAREIVATAPDIIFLSGATATARPFMTATTEIPIVVFVNDPLRLGLVESLARPGGNLTGVAADAGREMEGERLQLLHDAVPSVTRVGYLTSQSDWGGPSKDFVLAAADNLGITLMPVVMDPPVSVATIQSAFASMEAAEVEAVHVGQSGEVFPFFSNVAELALATAMPTIFPSSQPVVENGGLLGYGPNFEEMFRRLADYHDRILRGQHPSDMPIQQPEVFDFVVNLRTAKTIGISLPESILYRATQVIE